MSDRSVIVIDGSSAMSDEVQREFRFRLLPIHVLFGDEDFTPGVNLTKNNKQHCGNKYMPAG